MKKQVLFLLLYAALVVASVWLSLDPNKATWRRVLNEVIAIYFSIAFYRVWINLDKEKDADESNKSKDVK